MTPQPPLPPETLRLINETIAKWLGWNWTHYNGRVVLFPPSLWIRDPKQPVVDPLDFPNHEKLALSVPKFTSDLNAIATAEAKLTDKQYENFRKYLRGLVAVSWRALISASALDRSLALCKIIAPELKLP